MGPSQTAPDTQNFDAGGLAAKPPAHCTTITDTRPSTPTRQDTTMMDELTDTQNSFDIPPSTTLKDPPTLSYRHPIVDGKDIAH